MSKGNERRQKTSIKGFLAWVNADEDFDDEGKFPFDEEDEDEDALEEETEEHSGASPYSECHELHATLSNPAVRPGKVWEGWTEEEAFASIKADDAALVDYEGDDEFDYPDEIIVIDEFVSMHDCHHNMNGVVDSTGHDGDDGEVDYADSIPMVQEAVHMTKKEKRRLGRFRVFYLALSAIVALNVIGVLLLTVNFLPPFGGAHNPAVNEVYTRYVVDSVEETGALNMVSAVLYAYRSFDTLGEAFVLFTAAIGVIMLLQETKETKKTKKTNKTKNKYHP